MRNDEDAGQPRVLVASADVPYATNLIRFMEVDGYTLEHCTDAQGVLRLAGRRSFDVIVLDLELGEGSDIDLVTFIRRKSPGTQLILLFEVTQIERALEGIRHGAFFYIPKNSMPSDVAMLVTKALKSRTNERTMREYEQSVFEEFVGGSPAMTRVVELITKVAPTDSTVLLLGESGTGKEVMATAIHRLSSRREQASIAINCAALPEQLLESEMFGHVHGAFTGAHADKRGLFEEADGGTIFLDEIGDMALVTQAKLLRVLQNGEIRPVGSSTVKRVDVRVIAATNRDLEQAVAENRFREDLYFRLNVIQIRIPPLRERLDSLPRLVGHFISRYNRQYGKHVTGLDEHAQSLLKGYAYPGNIRELESIIAHAVIMADDDEIRARDLPESVLSGGPPRLALPDYASTHIPTIADMERQLIESALDRLNGNQTEAAQKLGISRSTLWRKMKEYAIEK